jgi:hypothetical protein
VRVGDFVDGLSGGTHALTRELGRRRGKRKRDNGPRGGELILKERMPLKPHSGESLGGTLSSRKEFDERLDSIMHSTPPRGMVTFHISKQGGGNECEFKKPCGISYDKANIEMDWVQHKGKFASRPI